MAARECRHPSDEWDWQAGVTVPSMVASVLAEVHLEAPTPARAADGSKRNPVQPRVRTPYLLAHPRLPRGNEGIVEPVLSTLS